MNIIKKVWALIFIALVSSCIYSILGTLFTQISNGVMDLLYFLELFPHYFLGILPYFLLGWVPLSLLIEKVISNRSYFVKLIIYCSGGVISIFIFKALWNLGDSHFLSLLTYSLIYGSATAFVFFHTMLLHKAVFNKEWIPNTKGFLNPFVFVLALFALGILILMTNTGAHVNETLEEYQSIEELQKNSPLHFKLPSYSPDGVHFEYAQIYQDRNEISITIFYSGAYDKEYDLNTLIIYVTDFNMKHEMAERHDVLDEILINKNKGLIGRTAIIGDIQYMDVSLTWKEDEVYYAVSSDIHQNSIIDENELLKIAKSFN
jgi:hypothetical protein